MSAIHSCLWSASWIQSNSRRAATWDILDTCVSPCWHPFPCGTSNSLISSAQAPWESANTSPWCPGHSDWPNLSQSKFSRTSYMGAEETCWGFKQLCPLHFHCPQGGTLLLERERMRPVRRPKPRRKTSEVSMCVSGPLKPASHSYRPSIVPLVFIFKIT